MVPCVMGIIAQLEQNGEPVAADQITVYAYADGGCRSRCETIDGKLFLTVYGQGSEQLNFKAVDDNGQQYDIREELLFCSDIVGTRKQPYVFTLMATATALPEVHTSEGVAVEPIGVYNLSGLFVSKDTAPLRPGIYIVRYSNGLCKKIMIK